MKADEEYARNTLKSVKSDDYDSTNGDEVSKEPERDFDKLKARIKLRAVKKFTEDDIARK